MQLAIQSVADQYAAAVTRMEVGWTLLRANRYDPRLLVRFVRSLRCCERLRNQIEAMTKEGAL